MKENDKITLETAFEIPAWQVVAVTEPNRMIDVTMRYKDLLGIYVLFNKFANESKGEK